MNKQTEALKLALEAYIKAGIGNSTDFILQGKAYDLAIEALAPTSTTCEVQPEQKIDWKDMYEKEKRCSAMWLAKYEKVAGPDTKVYPVAQPEQEPFGYVWLDTANFRKKIPPTGESEAWNAVYTTPPKRAWVGLTRLERFEIEEAMSKYYDYQHQCKTVCLPEFAAAYEAKLKELNT